MKAWKHEFKPKSASSDPQVTGLNWQVQNHEVLVKIQELRVWMQNHELGVQIHVLRVWILKSRFEITSCEFKSMSSKIIKSTEHRKVALRKQIGTGGYL